MTRLSSLLLALVPIGLAMLSLTPPHPVFAPATPSGPANTFDAPDPDTSRALAPNGFDLQGHRGARGLAPENTLPAFRDALEIGVTTLELDVVISEDGKVVVSHEPWMSPVICLTPDGAPVPEDARDDHNIYQMAYEQVKAYDCGTRPHPDFPEQSLEPAHKPLLRDVIEMAEAYVADQDRGPLFYNVETKIRPRWEGTFTPGPEAFADAVLAVLRETGVERRATVQSFDPRTLIVAHARQTPVRLALLIAKSTDNGVEGNLQMLPFTPDIYSPNYDLVTEALLDAAHERGMLVVPWTVNAPADMTQLVGLGVDGLITDYPNRAAHTLSIWAR